MTKPDKILEIIEDGDELYVRIGDVFYATGFKAKANDGKISDEIRKQIERQVESKLKQENLWKDISPVNFYALEEMLPDVTEVLRSVFCSFGIVPSSKVDGTTVNPVAGQEGGFLKEKVDAAKALEEKCKRALSPEEKQKLETQYCNAIKTTVSALEFAKGDPKYKPLSEEDKRYIEQAYSEQNTL